MFLQADYYMTAAIIVGTLDGMREGKAWGKSGNQQRHKWPFDKIIKMLT